MGTVHRLSTAGAHVTLGQATEAYLATLGSPEQAHTLRAYSPRLRGATAEFGSTASLGELDADRFAA